ncbi:MAG: aminotransferase class I/II-fold pyridoxal phosphate-dependent enzyme [bacterium]
MNLIDENWRDKIAKRCGGREFDKPGTGYSFSSVLAEERELRKGNIVGDPTSALCALSIADPTWKMPHDDFKAGEEYYNSSANATRYTDNNGIVGTHEGIADYLNRNFSSSVTSPFTPDWVQYSPGSIKRLLAEYIPSALFDENTVLFFPDPGYGVIKSAINNHGATVKNIPINLDNKQFIDLESLNLDSSKKNILYLNIPHNPSGATYGFDEWKVIIDWAIDKNVILVVDEAYTNLRFDESYSVLDIPGWEQCCIVLQSVSKGWNATGLRFGWAIAHPTVIKALRTVMDVKDSGLFGPSIAMGLQCLRDEVFALETCDRYATLHRVLLQGLNAAGFKASMPGAGLCQFTPGPKSANGTVFANSTECAQWLRKELRISLMHYTMDNNPWLRWAVTIAPTIECGLPDEKAVISEVVRRLQSVKFEF